MKEDSICKRGIASKDHDAKAKINLASLAEEDLMEFKGIMICISHDESFVSLVCNLKLILNGVENTAQGKVID